MEELIKYSLGIDVSKDKIDVCFSEMDNSQRVKIKSSHHFLNNNKGFKDLELWITKHKKLALPLIIIIEATGVYYERLAIYLHQKNYSLAVVLPNRSKKYMQALGLKSKNDKIDASGLSRMGAEQSLNVWKPMGAFFYELRQLTRHHEQLQESKTHFNNQLHALEHSAFEVKEVLKQQRKLIALLEKQIHDTFQAIQSHINSNEDIRRRVENICKIKGVGLLTVATVIAETNGFELFENIRQLVSYSGYDVIENQSGNHSGKTKISKKGNSHIRRILHMSSLGVVRFNQAPFVDLYNRVNDKTGIKMKGYVAVQKKLLIYIYTLWKKNEAYNPDQNKTSGNDEPKPLFLSVFENSSNLNDNIKNEIVPIETGTIQDELPFKESPEALFLSRQK
jgi:transposase